jgi:hypothetical protein
MSANITTESGLVDFVKAIAEPGSRFLLRAFAPGNGPLLDSALLEVSAPGFGQGVQTFANTWDGLGALYYGINPRQTTYVHPDDLATGAKQPKPQVTRRRWLLVDIDGRSPLEAGELAQKAEDFLLSLGWPLPIRVFTGGGYHLLYRIDLPAADQGLVRRVLAYLAVHFSPEGRNGPAWIDTAVSDAARLARLPGTVNVKYQPARVARVDQLPGEIEAVPQERLEALAGPPDEGDLVASGPRKQLHPRYDLANGKRLATQWMEKRQPAVEDHGGWDLTVDTVCILVRGFALPDDFGFRLLLDWNSKNDPQWDEDELWDKWQYFVREGRYPWGFMYSKSKSPCYRSIQSRLTVGGLP